MVRNKDKMKIILPPPPHPPFFPDSALPLCSDSSSSSPVSSPAGMGSGIQLFSNKTFLFSSQIQNTGPCEKTTSISAESSMHFSTFPSPAHSSPSLARGPSPRTESFTKGSCMGSSHGLQFFKGCSSMCPFHGNTPPGRDCFSVGPPRATRPARKPAPVRTPLRGPVSARGLLRCGVLHEMQVDLPHCGPPWAAG